MRRFVRSLATVLLLAFAGATIEAPVASAWAQGASKQTRAKKAPAPRRAAVRQPQPAPASATSAPAAPAYDRLTGSSGGGY
jgi:hypothetical protein